MQDTKAQYRDPANRRSAKAKESELVYLGLGHSPKTELGRLLLAARREFFAKEGRFLDREELEREVHERRGDLTSDTGD